MNDSRLMVGTVRRCIVAVAFGGSMLASTPPALATCAAPGDNQVVVFADSDLRGACQLLSSPGYYPTSASFGLPNDSISSVWVGGLTRVQLYRDSPYLGPQADYEGPWWSGGTWWYNVTPNDDASSIVVSSDDGLVTPFWYLGDYPSDLHQNDWSVDAQGLAHDSSYWYLSSKSKLIRWPLGLDIGAANGDPRELIAGIPASLAGSYDHFGDPDVWDGYLFVPLEPINAGTTPMILVYDSGLNLVAWDWFSAAAPDDSGKMHAAWLAINSTGVLYTSGVRIDENTGVQLYQIDASQVPTNGSFFSYIGHQEFYRVDPRAYVVGGSLYPPVRLTQIQGGDLSDYNENLLYISNGCCDDSWGDPWGVRAFNLSTGQMEIQSENNYGLFNFQFSAGFTEYQEPEGMDFFDTVGSGLSNVHIPDSQLHVLLYGNRSQSIWLKHYSY